jgi:uncharacterized membrane protein
MALYVFALLIGVIAGLRSMTAPAAVSWGARLGSLRIQHTALAFLGGSATPYVLTVLALGELVADKLPKTPSRKAPVPFGWRLVTGGLSGAAIGASVDALIAGLVCGALGAVIGTFGGAEMRGKLAKSFGRDPPAALLEDLIALGGAALIVGVLL